MPRMKARRKNPPSTEYVKRMKSEVSKRHISSAINDRLTELHTTGKMTRLNPQGTETILVSVEYQCANKMPFPASSNSNSVLPSVDMINPQINAYDVSRSYEIVPNQTVHLPKLSVHKFADSKLNEKEAIKILYRDWMQKFIADYYDKGMKKKKIIALTGPEGIGKSYCLYLLCSQLRKDGYRVLYLPSCRYLSNSFDAFGERSLMVQELKFAFYDCEMQSTISRYETNEGVSLCETLSDLQGKYMQLYRKKVVLIFDELNTISGEDHQRKVESLLKTLSNTIPTVISYSANCKIDMKDTYYSPYKAKEFELKEEEAEAFIKTVIPDASYSDEEMKEIIDVSGAIPLYVADLIRAEGDNLARKIATFKRSVYLSVLKGFERFLKRADSRVRNNNVIEREMLQILLLSGRETKEIFTEYDKKIVKKTKSAGFHKYTIIHPTAKRAMWKVLSETLDLKTVDSLAKKVLWTGGAKGPELVNYILHRSIKQKRFVVDQFIDVRGFEFKYFTNVELNSDFFHAQSTLLMIPEGTNHEMYLYMRDANVLYGIQVTIEEGVKSHLKKAFQQLNEPGSRINVFLKHVANAFKGKTLPKYHQIFITKNERVIDEACKGYVATNLTQIAKDYTAVDVLASQ